MVVLLTDQYRAVIEDGTCGVGAGDGVAVMACGLVALVALMAVIVDPAKGCAVRQTMNRWQQGGLGRARCLGYFRVWVYSDSAPRFFKTLSLGLNLGLLETTPVRALRSRIRVGPRSRAIRALIWSAWQGKDGELLLVRGDMALKAVSAD